MNKAEIINKIETLVIKTKDDRVKLDSLTLLLSLQKEDEYKEKHKDYVENFTKILTSIGG